MFTDTIAAIATPPGEGSIAIVRLSGPQAVSIANQIFSGNVASYQSHTAHLGTVSHQGSTIDQALVLVMLAPKSFTGEHVVEFQCHGGFFACSQILEALIACGARPALPGEFSQRAFLNGKLDLIQAEAIQNLIAADNLDAFQIAQTHFQGHFSHTLQEISSLVIEALAFLETINDFSEDEQLDLVVPKNNIQNAINTIQDLISSFDQGQKLAQGTSIVLAGSPNAGKSSLLNALTNKQRAIVTNIPGTTRDILEEHWILQGKKIKLIDSAGLRDTDNLIEKEGIERAKFAMEQAEGIVWVMDSGNPDEVLPPILFTKPTLIVWNKVDVCSPQHLNIDLPQINISAKTGEGIQQLKYYLQRWLQKAELGKNSKVFLVSSRHHTLLQHMHQHLTQAQESLLHCLPPECVALDLRLALQAMNHLSGTDVTGAVLEEIFRRFCIGK